ncbi:DUF2523 family protein [Spongiibacter tropicus]|uniref:DUF2523 family protein n=1 Tax=Spongiibacter tropicus TaxID=454602 RepID=UPI0003B5BB8D|nr:DUF2523 family protein [Spongiibacter tropicus]
MSWDAVSQWIVDAFAAVWAFFTDLPKIVLQGILNGIASILETIPVPDFVANFSPADYIHSDIAWFLAMSGVDTALGIIGGALLFRFLRRILTLGIW